MALENEAEGRVTAHAVTAGHGSRAPRVRSALGRPVLGPIARRGSRRQGAGATLVPTTSSHDDLRERAPPRLRSRQYVCPGGRGDLPPPPELTSLGELCATPRSLSTIRALLRSTRSLEERRGGDRRGRADVRGSGRPRPTTGRRSRGWRPGHELPQRGWAKRAYRMPPEAAWLRQPRGAATAGARPAGPADSKRSDAASPRSPRLAFAALAPRAGPARSSGRSGPR